MNRWSAICCVFEAIFVKVDWKPFSSLAQVSLRPRACLALKWSGFVLSVSMHVTYPPCLKGLVWRDLSKKPFCVCLAPVVYREFSQANFGCTCNKLCYLDAYSHYRGQLWVFSRGACSCGNGWILLCPIVELISLWFSLLCSIKYVILYDSYQLAVLLYILHKNYWTVSGMLRIWKLPSSRFPNDQFGRPTCRIGSLNNSWMAFPSLLYDVISWLGTSPRRSGAILRIDGQPRPTLVR